MLVGQKGDAQLGLIHLQRFIDAATHAGHLLFYGLQLSFTYYIFDQCYPIYSHMIDVTVM